MDKVIIEKSSEESTIASTQCSEATQVQSKIKKWVLKVTGLIFVGLAILGVVLPILPTTPFLLVAAACFAKSSPRLQKKLLANKTFGPLIHEWQQHRSIPRKAKRVALLTIILSVVWSAYLLKNIMLTLLVFVLVLGPFIFLWRLPVSK